MTGGVFAVTFIVKFAVDVSEPSETCRTSVLLPIAEPHAAAILAVIVPLVFRIPLTMIPDGMVIGVTVRLPAAVSASFTVAMVELVAAVPCCLLSGLKD